MAALNKEPLETDSEFHAFNVKFKLYETEITNLSTLDSIKKWAGELDSFLRISGSSSNYIYYRCSYAKKRGFSPCSVKARLAVEGNTAIFMISNTAHNHQTVANGHFDGKPPLIEAAKEEIQSGVDEGLTPKNILQNIIRRYETSAVTLPAPTLVQIQSAVQRQRKHRVAATKPDFMEIKNKQSLRCNSVPGDCCCSVLVSVCVCWQLGDLIRQLREFKQRIAYQFCWKRVLFITIARLLACIMSSMSV